MSKYITITPNPCFDRTIQIGDFVFDSPNRIKSELLQSSGKGINLSLVFAAHGLETLSFLLAGRDNYGQYAALLPKEIYLCPILVNGAIRENMTICSSDDKIVKLNRAGASYTDQAHAELQKKLIEAIHAGDYCIISGSLPPAMTQEQLAEIAVAAKEQGAKLVMDSEWLTRDVLRQLKPFIIKPNHVELAKLFGKAAFTPSECVEAAKILVEDGVSNVVVSLGGDGLIAVTAKQMVQVTAPKVPVVSTVAAGDSALSGFIMHYDEGLETAAKWAASYGSAAVTQPGSTVGDKHTATALFDKVQVVRAE